MRGIFCPASSWSFKNVSGFSVTTNTLWLSYLPALKFLIAVSKVMIEQAIPAGLPKRILSLIIGSLATLSSITITRCAPDWGAHIVATIPCNKR